MMTPVEILRQAKERLAQPGVWVNHVPDSSGCECAVTACASVDREGLTWDAAATFLDHAAVAAGVSYKEGFVRPAAQFNDTLDRTLEEVLSLFDFAIFLAKSNQ